MLYFLLLLLLLFPFYVLVNCSSMSYYNNKEEKQEWTTELSENQYEKWTTTTNLNEKKRCNNMQHKLYLIFNCFSISISLCLSYEFISLLKFIYRVGTSFVKLCLHYVMVFVVVSLILLCCLSLNFILRLIIHNSETILSNAVLFTYRLHFVSFSSLFTSTLDGVSFRRMKNII